MKAFASALLLIAFCYPVSAADQFVGTYKLNPAKSASSGLQVPPDLTLTIAEDGGNLLITTFAKAADGSRIRCVDRPESRWNGQGSARGELRLDQGEQTGREHDRHGGDAKRQGTDACKVCAQSGRQDTDALVHVHERKGSTGHRNVRAGARVAGD